MKKEPKILILEDRQTDADLAVRELHRAGLKFEFERVETKDQFLDALKRFDPDLILSDYTLPQFNGLEALQLLKEANIDRPFILCTGSLTEELAVECMKQGAADYILKTSLTRLPSAVINALETWESRRAREAALTALRESEEKFRSIVETTNEWIWACDTAGRITYSNPAVKHILGYDAHEVVGMYATDITDEDDRQLAEDVLRNAAANVRGWSQQVFRCVSRNSDIRFLESNAVPMFDPKGKHIGYRGSKRDITDRKLAEEKLLFDAFHDGLTGLANRTLFVEHLKLTIERGKGRHSNAYAVLYLDFDRFKVVNDSLGHTEGDNLLRAIARRLETCVRPGDLVARFGGDEFVILLSELATAAEALLVAERILNDLKNSFKLGERDIFISTSIGVALSTSKHERAEDMIRDADIAMYCAKDTGRAQYRIFDDSMHERASRKLRLETDMRAAIERGEFCLHYQPIVNIESGGLTGFEALMRWQHPKRGMVSPMEFIPLAEENGLILELGKWAVWESCRQLREWQESDPAAASLQVSVNLSSKEFRQPDLAEVVAMALRSTGLTSDSLKLEITESHIMENSERALVVINNIRRSGIEFSLDDFGTGYSSLSYLHRLPFSYLKVDRSFVGAMNESAENYEIVHTIIKLARSLKMKVVAEGIETLEQFECLRQMECDFGQGYWISKPLDADKARLLIQETVAGGPAGTGRMFWDVAGKPGLQSQ